MCEELKKCPICRGEAIVRTMGSDNAWIVDCSKCKILLDEIYNTEAEAITAWNKRPAEDDLLEALEKINKLLPIPRHFPQHDVLDRLDRLDGIKDIAEQAIAKARSKNNG